MNTKLLLASAVILAFTLNAPAQEPPPQAPPPADQQAESGSNAITINILGEANRPGRVTLPRGSGLLDAIASVGGFSRIANPRKITIIHKTAGPKPDFVKIDWYPIVQGSAKDFILRDGDTIVIGQSTF
jgi:polysaccharide export outer membrane protein